MPLTDVPLGYCPGCTHSHLHGLLAELLDSSGWAERAVGVCGFGCSSGMQRYFRFPIIQAPPGQAPAVATGIKRSFPEKLVFTYQGDGDLAARGLDVLMHAAARGESITVLCLNNLVMAGSGGQMSPTTLTGQVTTSTRLGRSAARSGKPVKLAELVAKMPEVAFSQRVALHDPGMVQRAKLALRDAFLYQENGQGLSFIEVLGWCPPYWDCTATEAREQLKSKVLKRFPLGIYQNAGLRK